MHIYGLLYTHIRYMTTKFNLLILAIEYMVKLEMT